RLEHGPAGARAHPATEPVLLLALPVVRLEGPLHAWPPREGSGRPQRRAKEVPGSEWGDSAGKCIGRDPRLAMRAGEDGVTHARAPGCAAPRPGADCTPVVDGAGSFFRTRSARNGGQLPHAARAPVPSLGTTPPIARNYSDETRDCSLERVGVGC